MPTVNPDSQSDPAHDLVSNDPGSTRLSLAQRAAVLGVRAYQVVLGPLLGGRCRFYPSCSHYAIEAIQQWGAVRGCWLAAKRVARCHPLCKEGYDPVPRRPDPHDHAS